MTEPRGLRNHNPGNIEHTGTPWQGLDDPPSDGRFCRFKAPEWGIRAIARTLITYQDKHDITTVRGVINRWAPSHENDTGAYVSHVAQKVGVGPDDTINLQSYEHSRPLVEAIILHENGKQPYSKALIDKGLLMAGIKPPPVPAMKSPAIAGGTILAGATVAAQTVSQFEAVWTTLQKVGLSPHILMALTGLAVLGVVVWQVVEWRKGR